MGLMGILECLIDRPLSPIFFTDVRGLIFIVRCNTREAKRETIKTLGLPECIAVRTIQAKLHTLVVVQLTAGSIYRLILVELIGYIQKF